METESESSTSGDDSVFWVDSEVTSQGTDQEEGDREEEDDSRKMKSSVHSEEDDFVPELHRNIHPRERPDWEETLSAMARGADVPEIPGDLSLKTCSTTASMKVKHVKKLPFTKGHFPKMAECAHFHYENVEFGSIQLSLSEEQNEVMRNGCDSKELVYLVHIACQGKSWIVKRSYEDFRVLDKHLHLCIYDRRFSQLSELPRSDALRDSPESVTQMLMAYLSRLSAIAGNKINCGPALTWMEIDNKGNHLLVHEESSINTPAVGAAHVIKRYTARAPDELNLEVGDIVSVIDMPPKVLSTWWRGKHGFQVGLFPGHCVELINQKVPQSVTNSVPKPVSKKHGKLITFLRTFMKSRPTKQKLKQRGILKERVFGCDLGEHLLNSGFEVPQVLQSCTAFIERYGIVDGIYRLSGVASNIQRLRHEFDSEHVPDLTKEPYVQDIHSVGSLCKLYFRELPNPLLTYQLYEKFSDAVSAATDEERLIKIHDVIQQLPPPHYRTLEFLMRHLSLLADYCSITNMHAKNLAIVWAPNLLRSKQIESACFSGTAAFMEVRIQSVVVEFILNHVDVLFSGKISAVIQEGAAALSRPKSLLVSSPSTKLLTLEEAQARTQAQVNSPMVTENKYIEVGEGPAALQGKFHTIIEFPLERRRPQNKMKKSPVGSWRSFFNLGKSSSVSKRKLQRNESEPSEMKAMALKGGRAEGTLRSAKSEESLTSLHAVDGDSKLFRPRRPRSSSDALSASFNGDVLGNRCNSYDNLPRDHESEEEVGLLHIPALISPHSADDVDLSPPDIGVASLDFDPMSFQCSPPKADTECLESGASFLDSLGYSKEAPGSERKEAEAGGGQSQTPGSAGSSEPVSPLQEKLSPFFTLDLSPPEERSSKPSTFTEKVVYALSPKIGRKLSKSPSLNISEPISVTLPPRVSEVLGTPLNSAAQCTSVTAWNRSVDEESDGTNRSSTQAGPARAKESETPAARDGGTQALEPGVAAAAVAEPAAPELPGTEEPSVPNTQGQAGLSGETPTGAVAHDPPQDPVPVSSASIIPPPPPPKNAARLLALALAESAQQASTQTLRRPGAAPAAPPDCGAVAAASTEDRAAGGYPSGALDKAYFQPEWPGEQPRLHDGGAGLGDPPGSDAAPPAGDHDAHCQAQESGEPLQLQQADPPGGQPPRAAAASSEEPDKPRVAPVASPESQCEDLLSFPEEQPEKRQHSVSFLDPAPSQLHFYNADQPPAAVLGPGGETVAHHPPELLGRALAPSSFPRDRLHLPSGSPDEHPGTAATATLGYLAAVEAATWDAVELPMAAEATAATLPRSHRTNRPLPPPPSQHPRVGQGPAGGSVGLAAPHKVAGPAPAPERPPEPRALADPGLALPGEVPAAGPQPGLPEKVREGARAPPLQLRAEPVPVYSPCGFSAPVPPTRTLESKIAAALHAGAADLPGAAAAYHPFAAAACPAPVDDGLPLPLPLPKPAPLKAPYAAFGRPDFPAEPWGAEGCVHFALAPGCQFRAQSVPPHHARLEPHPAYAARSEPPAPGAPHYGTYAAPGRSAKPCGGISSISSIGGGRLEYVPSLGASLRSPCYPEDAPPYPTIRRVQSLHAPPPPPAAIRSVPISRTEVPPDDEPAYCPRPLYQYKPYQPAPSARSDYHVTQLQPYFENGRVHYRYSPYAGAAAPYLGADGALGDVDAAAAAAYGTVQLRPLHRLPAAARDLALCHAPRLPGKTLYGGGGGYGGLPARARAAAAGYFAADPAEAKAKAAYASWDLEDADRYRLQSLRRESRARHKAKGPVVSQYDNLAPAGHDDLGGVYVIHLRSKSDPGKTGLLSVAEAKEGRPAPAAAAAAAKAVSPQGGGGEERFYRKHPEPELERAHTHPLAHPHAHPHPHPLAGYGNGQAEKPALPQKQSSLRGRKPAEVGCGPAEPRAHQDASHRQLCEPKNGPPFAPPLGPLDYEPGGKYVPSASASSGHEALTLRLHPKEGRPFKEPERARAAPRPPPDKHARDCCYPDDEPLALAAGPPPKPERSHSLKLHPGPAAGDRDRDRDRDPAGPYHYAAHGKRHGAGSAAVVVSQYDNLEGYHSLPQHQHPRAGLGGAAGGPCLPTAAAGFPHPQSRTYATALGQGAFLPAELALQRPEAQVHAE